MNRTALALLLLVASAALGAGYTVELRAVGPNKILVIKLVREATGRGLKETKDLVEAAPKVVKEQLERPVAEALAVRLRDAGATVVVSNADGTAAVPSPRTVATLSAVTLTAPGPNKIEVIKIVREVTGLGLKEAKDLVEKTPCVVKAGLPAADAQALASRLAAAGAAANVTGDDR